MNIMNSSRREWLGGVSGTVLAGLASPVSAGENENREPFRFCLNTSTIRGQRLSILQEIEIAQQAGYQGIEPWIRELEQYVQGGGTLRDLGRRIADAGLQVESGIGFPRWIVDDDKLRRQALEQARREMDMIRQIGGTRVAAPPAGATNQPVELDRVAERYYALCEVGRQIGVVPQIEVWGFSRTLGRLSECAYVAIQSGHSQACILADVYHLYKGGSDFNTLRLLNGEAMHLFHINDYPAQPPRAEISDSHRVYPGLGVAPLTTILRDLRTSGFRGALSLELFNRTYWQQEAISVARTGIERMRAAVRASQEG